eukprot:6067013-Karenia_brevis.AAC.1
MERIHHLEGPRCWEEVSLKRVRSSESRSVLSLKKLRTRRVMEKHNLDPMSSQKDLKGRMKSHPHKVERGAARKKI